MGDKPQTIRFTVTEDDIKPRRLPDPVSKHLTPETYKTWSLMELDTARTRLNEHIGGVEKTIQEAEAAGDLVSATSQRRALAQLYRRLGEVAGEIIYGNENTRMIVTPDQTVAIQDNRDQSTSYRTINDQS